MDQLVPASHGASVSVGDEVTKIRGRRIWRGRTCQVTDKESITHGADLLNGSRHFGEGITRALEYVPEPALGNSTYRTGIFTMGSKRAG